MFSSCFTRINSYTCNSFFIGRQKSVLHAIKMIRIFEVLPKEHYVHSLKANHMLLQYTYYGPIRWLENMMSFTTIFWLHSRVQSTVTVLALLCIWKIPNLMIKLLISRHNISISIIIYINTNQSYHPMYTFGLGLFWCQVRRGHSNSSS